MERSNIHPILRADRLPAQQLSQGYQGHSAIEAQDESACASTKE
jgi:hypothetical protein